MSVQLQQDLIDRINIIQWSCDCFELLWYVHRQAAHQTNAVRHTMDQV